MLKSIGFKSLAVPGVAFDARAGIIPNSQGQVRSGNGWRHACDFKQPYLCALDLLACLSMLLPLPTLLQVYAEDGASFEPGLFVCGWLKRGPSGGCGVAVLPL